MFCNKCGNEISETDEFCNKCGEKVNKTNVQDNSSLEERSPAVIFLGIIIMIIAFVLLASAGFSIGSGGSKSKPTNMDIKAEIIFK